MTRFVVLVLAAGLAVVVAASKSKEECIKLFYPPPHNCCKTVKPVMQRHVDAVNECSTEPTCDTEICIFKKQGLVKDDGTLDKDGFKASFEDAFKDNPELVNKVKEKCFAVDLDKNGPPELCYFAKMRYCADTQLILSCTEWNDDGPCNEMKMLADECLPKYI